jgi:hypothetical protein
LQLGGELFGRYQQAWIECDQQVAEITDIAVSKTRPCHQSERLNSERQAVPLVATEWKDAAIQQIFRDRRRLPIFVDTYDVRK